MKRDEIIEMLQALLDRVRGCREVLTLETNVRLELRGPDGELKDVREVHNLVCTVGKQKLLSASAPNYLKDFKYLALGTGTNAASAADTTLQTEIARSGAIVATNPDANTLQLQATFGAGVGTGALTELALFDAGVVGNILNRQVFAVVTKGALDTIIGQVQVTIT